MKIKLRFLGLLAILITSSNIFAAPISENFDGFTSGSYGNHTYNGWFITNGLAETSANARGGTGRAVRLRNSGSPRSLQSPSKTGGVGTIEFWYRHWDGDANTLDYDVQTSPDGSSWTTVGQITGFNSTTYTQFSLTVNDPTAQYVRVIHVSGAERLIIDDFSITDAPTGPLVGFDNLTANSTEGNSINIPVTLTNGSSFPVVMDVNLSNSLSSEGGDFSIISSTLTFNADGTQNVVINLNQDADYDDETFEITLTENTSTGVIIAPASNTVTILDDDIPATLGFDNTTSNGTEGNTILIPVSLTSGTVFPVTLSITPANTTAEGGDYTLNTTALTFNATGTQNVELVLNPDADYDDEELTLTLAETSSTGATITTSVNTITITDAGCPHSLTSFAPTSAPAGAEITIFGTGFSASSTVTIGGATATVSFIDATTLIATVPAGATSGDLIVNEAACDQTLAGFSFLEQNGSCAGTFSDLVISEVYDNTSGSLGYIEIYNGTGASIDLSDYRIDRFGNIGDATPTFSYTFPAITINDGETLYGRVSSDPDIATPDFVFTGSTSGFNDNDRLELVHIPSGSIVDDFHDATVGTVGYVYRRNTTITGPNPTFTSSEWTTVAAGDISDLGNFISPAAPPSINTQPTDISACAINMSISATAGGGGTLTYQWYYNENDGIATGWTAVSGAAFPNASVSGETTDNLSITGDLADYDGYQFYCELTEDGACNVPTEAVQFSLNAERFFRSAASGNWTDAANWEMATSAAGPWSTACTYPVFDNSDYIHILNTHNITLDQTLTVDEVVVETGGTLTIGTATKLFFNNGTGIDLEVQGTLIDNGLSLSNGGVNFSDLSATWELAANGEIIKTGSSSVAQYRDNYQNGISNIPSTAIWRYRYTGTSPTVTVASVNMYYPNLFIESVAGDYSFNAALEIFGGNSGFMTVNGNMFVGTTGSDAVEIFNTNTHPTMMRIMGNLTIGGNGSASRSKIGNEFGGNIGTGITVMGNLLINTNGELDFDDEVNGTPEGTFRLFGNWTNLATENDFKEGESTVIFEGGTAAQSISISTGFERYYNIIMNKSNGTVDALSDIHVINDVSFNNGIIDNSFGHTFLFEVDATSTNPSDASHINGPVNKITDNAAVSSFTFPTGKNGRLGLIGIETRFNTGEEFLAEYFDTGYGTYNVNTAELHHVSQLEWWELDDVNNLGENARVTLHWRAHSDVVSVPDLRVAHYFTEAPSVVDQWESEGANTTTGILSAGTITSDYVTTFSPFTLSDILLNGGSLPLDLLYFEAEKVEATAELNWKVANDRAGDRHCIERSANAQEFITLGCIDATQDQATAYYQFTDETPLSGDNYYRIAHADVEGELNYSPVRVLNFETREFVNIYPNPVQDVLNIDFPQATEQIQLELVDALGRIVLSKTIEQTEKNVQLNTSNLAAGHYILRIKVNAQTAYNQKFEKQ